MGSKLVRVIAGLCVAGMTTAATAQQADSTNRVSVNTDWSVFVEEDPTECWSVATPDETVNTRGGRVVSVRRSDILLFVVFRPDPDVKGRVSFTGGYPFAAGSTVSVSIDGNSFEFSTEGEWAWPASEGDDQKVIAAMKSGTEAVLTARSERGTQTKDTFSLLGFTAALDDAEKRCTN
ncbi:invasion associated locus B family protein [Ruegeria faecimaris]|uniref:Invasion protein IalB, involved in pathogenesis n=1 Tax=Ruegeria faecimaris TaxID=686389 RepID=A0A521DAM6_9RHOB|nr:invasion associated locus B family protein [Ruegeria faecimaris]SMO68767.1 Invasion protein IalB, involved in pathogenesis [Ruegeria faecimaris]